MSPLQTLQHLFGRRTGSSQVGLGHSVLMFLHRTRPKMRRFFCSWNKKSWKIISRVQPGSLPAPWDLYPTPTWFLGVTWFLKVKKSIENHSFWVKKSKKAIIKRRAIRGYHHYLLCSFLWRFIVKNISDQNIPDHYRSENLDQQAQDQISTKSSKHSPVAFSEMEIKGFEVFGTFQLIFAN